MKIDEHFKNYIDCEKGEVVVIVKDDNGIEYHNQTGGISCNYNGATGYVYTIGFSEHDYFSPAWWYDNVYRMKCGEEGFIHGWEFDPFDFSGINEGTTDEEFDKYYEALRLEDEKMINSPNFITWSEFIPKFEKELNAIENNHFKNFKINEMEEAWAEGVCEREGKQVDIVVTWRNCD